jgi:hypothetical protein
MSSVEVQPSFYESIINNITWKRVIFAITTVFFIYPKPFLHVFNPLMKRVARSYERKKAHLNKIFLVTDKTITPEKLVKEKAFNGKSKDILVINLL